MHRIFHIILIILILLTGQAAGLSQGPVLSLEFFGEDKGLNITYLSDIFQDREGFIWLGAREGLLRYDGQTFRYFRNDPADSTSIAGNGVTCITEDASGNIWAGLLRGGVSCYERSTGRFRNYPFTKKLKIKTASVYRVFFDRDENIWLGVTGYGIGSLNPENGAFKHYDLVTESNAPHLTPEERPNYNTAQNFWQDEAGLIWCATSDDLHVFNPKTGEVIPHRYDKVAYTGFRQNQAFALLPEGDSMWVGGWGSGLRHYNRSTGEWKQYLMYENAPSPDGVNVINGMARKSEHELWVSSEDLGFGIFDTRTEKFTFLDHAPADYPGFPSGATNNLFIDRQGNIWLNMMSRLLKVKIKESLFRFKPFKSERPLTRELYWISEILEDRKGRFRFIGLMEGDGLQIEDLTTGKTIVPDLVVQPGVVENNRLIMDILEAGDGTIWILGRHILYRFNPNTLRLDVPPQPPVYSTETGTNHYTQMTEDKQGNIWLGSSLFGVFRYNPRTGKTDHYMPDEKKPGAIATNVVGSVAVDKKGRTWYGSRDKTAYGYFLPEEDRFVYLDANGLPTREIATLRMNSYIVDSTGDIWACTEEGLFRFDCSGDEPRLERKYNMADGFPSDFIAWGQEDEQGNMWVTASKNLCKLEVSTGKISSYGQRDGLPFSYLGMGRLNNGLLFLKAQFGYFYFNPNSLQPALNQAPVVLTSFKVNDREQYNGSEKRISQRLEVPTDGRYFSVEFAALDYSNPELCQYEYRLEGFDDLWVAAGNRHFVNFTNIPSGHYLFQVKLAGTPDEEALSVPLVVRVSFYKTTWFWMLSILALVAGGLVYLRHQQEQKRQVEALKNKTHLLEKEKALVQYESLKQQLNPHFLFNSLTSLGSLISIDPKSATLFLDRLSKTYRYILKSSERETVPLQEELKFGESFVELQKTRFGAGLQVHFKVGEEDFHRKIVPVTLQNLIENAIKHNIIDEESPLVIEVFVEDGYVVVRNNLQKKKFVETSNKRGLVNLQSFYRYLSDKPIQVQEEADSFTIRIPLI